MAQLNRDVSEALREKQGVEVELQQTQTTLQTVEVKLNALQDEAQSTIRGLMKELKATEDAHTTERRRLRKDLDNAIDVSEQHKREKDRLHDNQGRAVEALETDMEQQVNRLILAGKWVNVRTTVSLLLGEETERMERERRGETGPSCVVRVVCCMVCSQCILTHLLW